MVLLSYLSHEKFQEVQFFVSENLKDYIKRSKSEYFTSKFIHLYRLLLLLVALIVYYGLFIDNLPIISKLGQDSSSQLLSWFVFVYFIACIIIIPVCFFLVKETINVLLLNQFSFFKNLKINNLFEFVYEIISYPVLISMPKLIAEIVLPKLQVGSIILSPSAFHLNNIQSLKEYLVKMLLAINLYAFFVTLLLMLSIKIIPPSLTLAISPLINNLNKDPRKRVIHPFDYIFERVLKRSCIKIQAWDQLTLQDIISIVDNKINGLSTQSQSIQIFLGIASFISLYTLVLSKEQISRRIDAINLRDFILLALCLVILGSFYYFMQLYWSLHVLQIVKLACLGCISQKQNSDMQVCEESTKPIDVMHDEEKALPNKVCELIWQLLPHW